MRRLFTWLAGAAGGLAAYRAVKRPKPEPVVLEVDPAEALRAKIAEVRGEEMEAAQEAAEAEEPADAESRRRSVHERGRAALDEMHGDGA